MASSIDEIKKLMTDVFISKPAVIAAYNLDVTKTFEQQFSVVSIESIIFYIVAFCCFVQQTLFDKSVTDTNTALATKKPHRLQFYAEQAKTFQFGFPLLADKSGFDNTGYTTDEIEASKVVDYSAVVEQENQFGRVFLRMKLAHDNGTDLEPLAVGQFTAFIAWFKSTQRDGGVKMEFVNQPADDLKQSWTIFYDPLILSDTGARLDGSDNQPVQNAIKGYLKNLPFNGVYAPTYHTDAVQLVPGVVIPQLRTCSARYGSLPFAAVNDFYTPDSGYLRFANTVTDLVIEFIAQTPIK
ncbi:MAG: hypothetical protein JWP81_9 [Ferruginibacter sp.]|nr:hypothetical protein [Ferruginibacter sp.]